VKLPIQKFRDPAGATAAMIGTFLGSGLLPKAPGTWGSLAALPLVFLSHQWSPSEQIFFWLVITGIGTWAAKEICERTECSDNQAIVIDEVIGMGITAWTSAFDWKWLWISFFFFRLFDMTKPPPVRAVDRWSKNAGTYWARGFGVLADDIVAGFQGLIVVLILQKYFP